MTTEQVIKYLEDPDNITPEVVYALAKGLEGVKGPNRPLHNAVAAVGSHVARLDDPGLSDCA